MSKIKLITTDLGSHLLRQIEKAPTICILTSFVMKSGVAFLKDALASAAKAGADIKIGTGDYLHITQPEGLAELLAIDENIEIRLWKSNGVSFHPKAYLFKSDSEDCLFIGSSNLSKSALHNGVEWNLSVSNEKRVFNDALNEFLKVFYADQTVKLNDETLKDYKAAYERYHKDNPNVAKVWSDTEEMDLMLPTQKEVNVQPEIIHDPPIIETYGGIKPRFAQVEALEELERTREEEYQKALVVMATGLGKTYLAGFFAKDYKKILFIAHREEILYQAKQSFKNIMPDRKYGIYNGKHKDSHADAIFASIYTLSMKAHIERFSPDEFDLLIVDEFHHAAAESYQRVLDYFKPEFLLGITATPDRNDNKDVFAICDGNVAYRLDFLDAINRQWLAPFKYYGVYDETDYSQITWLGTRYDEEELLHAQLREEMASKILEAWKDKKQTRTIGFCSSIRQANFLSSFFNKQGYKTVSLHSQQKEVGRADTIKKLETGELDIIFTVDLFNEGVDIPPVDTLLFVRPTESLTVFTQQIGRGLRFAPGKDHCVIIDLIGNYRNADVKLSLFDIARGEGKSKKIEPRIPSNCELNLDLQVVNLLKEMAKKRSPRKEKLLDDYFDLKHEMGRRPTYLELHLKGHSDSTQYRQEFNSYVGFLNWTNELSKEEKVVFERYENWLVEVEKTSMSKSYKMVLLLAMLNRGINEWFKPITAKEVAPFFHHYLTETKYRKTIDFSDKSSIRLWEYNEKAVRKLIETMPMTKWNRGDDGLTSFSNGLFTLNFDVLAEDQETLYNWTRQIAEYRLHVYFERKAKNDAH
jgi:superfamily II DNA or RNA helicase/HKD family nuclease